MISYGKQSISQTDIDAVTRVLKSDFLTSGPEVEAFEREFAAFVGAKYAVAVCNATAALHLAMRVLGVGSRDRVVTSPNTFLASANAAAYVGATPDFCDISLATYNLDPKTLEDEWKSDTKAVVTVDYAGRPSNMPEIARIARKNGAYVIEDACHGVGGGFHYQKKFWKLGGHPWADITTFSFHPVKTMTTGEGGMLVTDNLEWAEQARRLRSHGVTRSHDEFVGLEDLQPSSPTISASRLSEQGPWYYEMQDLGFNYRLTDFQSALGRSQLLQLPDFIVRRQEIAAVYTEHLSAINWLKLPEYHEKIGDFHYELADLSLHLFTVLIDFEKIGKSRTQCMQELSAKGIGTQVLYIPVYLQPWYRSQFGYSVGKCPNSEKFYHSALSIPLHPALTDSDIETVVCAIKQCL